MILLIIISNDKKNIIKYIAFILVLPSLFGSSYAITQIFGLNNFFQPESFNLMLVWIGTNIVIIGGFVTPFLVLWGRRLSMLPISVNRKDRRNDHNPIQLRYETIVYLIGLICWIYLFVIIHTTKWIPPDYSIFILLPFLLGTIFLLVNVITSNSEEICTSVEEKKKEFVQLEERVVVAEKNTESILLVLTILLAIASSEFSSNSNQIVSVLIAAATFACFAIVIVWVPKSNVRLIRILKSIKTTFHIYTVSFLLFGAVLILLKIGNP
jgi:hypothetical protein